MDFWSESSNLKLDDEDFKIEVTGQSVNVRLNASAKSPHERFYWCAFFVALWIATLCFIAFTPGKNGAPSMWHDLAAHPVNSPDFFIPLTMLLGFSALLVFISRRYIVMAYPSDETFYCDRSTLTISKVRWLDIYNKDWRSHSYSLQEVKEVRYRAITRLRGGTVYGLCFKAEGRTERVLPGIGASDAGKVLKVMKELGADVTEPK